jgi:hypothetical protein
VPSVYGTQTPHGDYSEQCLWSLGTINKRLTEPKGGILHFCVSLDQCVSVASTVHKFPCNASLSVLARAISRSELTATRLLFAMGRRRYHFPARTTLPLKRRGDPSRCGPVCAFARHRAQRRRRHRGRGGGRSGVYQILQSRAGTPSPGRCAPTLLPSGVAPSREASRGHCAFRRRPAGDLLPPTFRCVKLGQLSCKRAVGPVCA